MTPAASLRRLIRSPELVVAPGAYDGITARLIEQHGYSAVYMTGAGRSSGPVPIQTAAMRPSSGVSLKWPEQLCCVVRVSIVPPTSGTQLGRRSDMNGIIYLVGLVVVVMFILSFLGLR